MYYAGRGAVVDRLLLQAVTFSRRAHHQIVVKIAIGGAIGIAAGFVLLVIVVAVLPRDFFTRPPRSKGPVKKILKNALGAVLLVGGIILSLPLVPGPGFVLILAGLVLLDIPGRQKVLRKAFSRPGIHRKLNAFRRRLHRPYFLLPESATES
jgi:hypothetical protein